jgi:hypothetical protein
LTVVDEYVFVWAFGEMKLKEAFEMRFWKGTSC